LTAVDEVLVVVDDDVVGTGVEVIVVMALPSDADVEPAAAGGEAAVIDQNGFGDGARVLDVEGRRGGTVVVGLLLRALVAQRELQSVLRGLQPGILEGAIEIRCVAAEQVERLDAIDHEA
jgi:hypothetical protein